MNRREHLLSIVSEECAEIAQRASKAARFGLGEIQYGQDQNNAQRLVAEYADLRGVIELLEEDGHLVIPDLRPLIDAKKAKVEKFLLYSAECGTLK